MEVFVCCFVPVQYDQWYRWFEGIQDKLGEINDLCEISRRLQSIADSVDDVPLRTLSDVGTLRLREQILDYKAILDEQCRLDVAAFVHEFDSALFAERCQRMLSHVQSVSKPTSSDESCDASEGTMT